MSDLIRQLTDLINDLDSQTFAIGFDLEQDHVFGLVRWYRHELEAFEHAAPSLLDTKMEEEAKLDLQSALSAAFANIDDLRSQAESDSRIPYSGIPLGNPACGLP